MSNSELLEVYLEKESNGVQEKRLFICNLCPYRTDRRNNLKRHTSTMHEQSAAVLECCGTRFANKAALRHHTTAYHRNGYICTICGRVFCRRALLRRHHAVHSGFKEFSCSLCDYATSHKSNLERHMKIHDGQDKHYSPVLKSKLNDNGSTDYSEDDDEASGRLLSLTSPISRDHNPILASLLSQPTSHSDLLHWSYRSIPYDYSVPIINSSAGTSAGSNPASSSSSPSAASGSTPSPSSVRLDLAANPRRWSYEPLKHGQDSQTLIKENGLPLRHAIDVILGVQKDLQETNRNRSLSPDNSSVRSMTTSSQNHWAISHVTSAVMDDPLAMDLRLMYARTAEGINSHPDSGIDSDRSSVGSKRRWTDGTSVSEADPLSTSPPSQNPSNEQLRHSSPEHDGEHQIYIPKKLRMSKRYQ